MYSPIAGAAALADLDCPTKIQLLGREINASPQPLAITPVARTRLPDSGQDAICMRHQHADPIR
jgi:hypothetical protein